MVAAPTAAPASSVSVIRTGLAPPDQIEVVTTSGWRVSPGPAVGTAVGPGEAVGVTDGAADGATADGPGETAAVVLTTSRTVAAIASASVPNGKVARSTPAPSMR